MADEIYVLGDITPNGNRELVFVPDGTDTDLPAAAEFAYSNAFTRFPY